jgi:hypothetical protein
MLNLLKRMKRNHLSLAKVAFQIPIAIAKKAIKLNFTVDKSQTI